MTCAMPLAVSIQFTHATLQTLAEEAGVDLLHIKGPAVHEQLLDREQLRETEKAGSASPPIPRPSIDADVLVRPSHLGRLGKALRRNGWATEYRFEDDSPFEHASAMHHPVLAPVDVHRSFPGIGLEREAAFERLWIDRRATLIAGYACSVPSLAGQRLMLLLNAARGLVAGNVDVRRTWTEATEADRRDVESLARDLRAEVALAAASGRLDDFRTSREHDLWAALSSGESSPVKMWAARVRAAPTRREATRTAVRLVLPKPGRLAASLGRRPTGREIAAAYIARARWGAAELVRFIQSRARRRVR